MTHHHRLGALALVACAALVVASCSAAPDAVRAAPERPDDCNAAIAAVWPPPLQARAEHISFRESRNTPWAQNRRSSAAGCFQLLALHASRFTKLGLDWGRDRYDALANTQVAFDLFLEQGWRPWA